MYAYIKGELAETNPDHIVIGPGESDIRYLFQDRRLSIFRQSVRRLKCIRICICARMP